MRIINRFMNDEFIKLGSLMFISASLTGFINIFYRVLMGRLLTLEQFGEFSAMYSLFFFRSYMGMTTIRTAVTDHVSRREIGSGMDKDRYRKIITITMIASISFALIMIAFSPIISGFMNIEDPFQIILVGSAVLLSWLLPANLGTFQGMQRFIPFAVTNFIQFSMKLVGGVILVAMGFAVYGAVGGLLIGLTSALAFSTVLIVKNLKSKDEVENQQSKRKVNPNLAENHIWTTIHVFIAVLGLTSLTNIDVIMVKHFFPSDETGLYAAASLIGRVMFFFPLGFTMVMFPKVVQCRNNVSKAMVMLRKTLLYTSVPTLFVAIATTFCPELILSLIYGGKFTDAADLVRITGVMMLTFSIISIIVNYFLALARYTFIYIFTGISIVQIILIWFIHPSLDTILWFLLATNFVSLFLSVVFLRFSTGYQPKEEFNG